ncbi:hypothetical protein [Streptomyces sp. NPDC127084]|uniref:hypothetical protein n=1 Tax=Streptomyces sp. NPDC127084 TaxID=3347133 RepID=UPI00364C697E
MKVASFVLSILALCIGIGNLTWQWALYQLNGPRIRVRMAVGALGPGGLMTFPVEDLRDLTETFDRMAREGFTEPVIVVNAVNTGRLGVELLEFGIDLPKGPSVKWLRDVIGETPMPHVLEPHREGTWAMPFEPAFRVAAATQAVWPNHAHPIRAYVRRAGGEKIHGKHTLRLALPSPEATRQTSTAETE